MSKINLKIDLETDGDYSLPDYEKYGMKYEYGGYSGRFHFEDTTDDSYKAIRDATHVLENVLCGIRVAPGHYWIIKDLFEMFDGAIEALCRREPTYMGEVSGNYDGTEIEFTLEV